MAGTIVAWDPIRRWLQIGEQHFYVVSGVPISGLALGATAQVSGHQGNPGARWIVTQITLA
jgi:hypothetical protein